MADNVEDEDAPAPEEDPQASLPFVDLDVGSVLGDILVVTIIVAVDDIVSTLFVDLHTGYVMSSCNRSYPTV